MPKVKVTSNSKLTPQETFKKIKQMLETDADLRKLDSSYRCEFNDAQLTGSAKGGKFQAQLRVQNSGQGAQVEIDVDLPLMLTPVKGIVQSTLQKKLDQVLA